MKQTNFKMLSRQVSYAFIAAVMLMSYFPSIASAAPITDRSVVIGTSVASANTTYAFTFTVPSTTVIKSVSFAGCTTASGACTTAPGFVSTNTSTLTSQPTNLGDAAGWTVDTTSTGILKLKKTGNVAAPTPATPTVVSFSSVKNPSAVNGTFYLRIATFSDDAYTTGIDTGVIASSTAEQVTVTALVDETLTFTLASQTVPLGAGASMSTSSASTGTSTMAAATNAKSGYTISYTGSTLTGPVAIDAMSSATTSTPGTKQFGIYLAAAGGSGVAKTGYQTVGTYKFVTPGGEPVAEATAPTNATTYTVNYLANIDGSTPAGAYSTTITYTATAKF